MRQRADCGSRLLARGFDRVTRLLDRDLPRVRVPLLVIHSRLDRVVPPGNAQAIYDRVASRDKRIVWLERGGHIATEDYDKAIVFEETRRFIETYSVLRIA